MLLPSQSELPPKSLATLNVLTTKRARLGTELSMHCISDRKGCYDLARAKDYLRSYACSFFDLLKEAYSHEIHIWEWEVSIAEEAIQITLACWSNFNVDPPAEAWIETLRSTIAQHVGHPLRGRTQKSLEVPQGEAPSVSPPITTRSSEVQEEIWRRAKLLSEYKTATGNPSNKKIYQAQNSGIHKPEFYRWRNGRLPTDSKTAKTFEAFLRAKKRPIPRAPAG